MKKLLLAGAALAALIGNAIAQSGTMGQWSNLPAVGTQSQCSSYVNGVCVQMVGPGEAALTGNERIPNDTNLPGGQTPQTQVLTVANLAQLGQGSERNVLRGPDFLQNLWQRGTTFSSISPSSATMIADGWFAYSSGNVTTISQDTTTADLNPTLGINGAMKIVRPSGTNTSAICVGQILPQRESQRFIGRQAIFSFYANPLSGYLATNKQIIATLAVYTAADSSTPGTNTGTFAAGTIAGYTVINPTSATVTTAPAINLATGWTRYWVNDFVPLTVSTNNVIGIGVTICTPVYPASTGVAADGFLIANAQLEDSTAGTTVNMTGPGTSTLGVNSQTVTLAPANTIPGGFSRRPPALEAAIEQSYSYILKDGATTQRYGSGFAQSNALAELNVRYPVTMRETPALTVGTTISFGLRFGTASTAACGTSIAEIASSGTPNGDALLCTTGGTALTAGNGLSFAGANTGALLTWSAEP